MLGAACIIFHIWLIFSGLVPSLVARPMHMALALPWIFIFPAQSFQQRMLGTGLTIIGILCCLYIALNEGPLSDQYGFISGWHQLLISCALLGITIEMARRAIGWPLPSIAILFLLYGLFGDYIPGEFGVRLEDCMYITDDGAALFTPASPSIDDPFGNWPV